MELAEPRANGEHVYFRAMALLGVGIPATTDHARRLLIQLIKDYPESSYSESARIVSRMFSSDLGR
jgi:hypothetical protein